MTSHPSAARLFHVFELKGHTPDIAMYKLGKKIGSSNQQPVSITLWQFNLDHLPTENGEIQF